MNSLFPLKEIKVYEVGGCIRDELLGLKTHDIDFAVECDSFEMIHYYLGKAGFQVFLSTPEFLTIRARFPKTDNVPERFRHLTADFVMCRKESGYSDGRRPDIVEPGTLKDDLARRDFTMNAIARPFGYVTLVDPHGGVWDIEQRVIRFVGTPMERIEEDGLRVLRALRFMVTKGMSLHTETHDALVDPASAVMLSEHGGVSIERIREELNKMLKYNSLWTMKLLTETYPNIGLACFRDGLRLDATLKS